LQPGFRLELCRSLATKEVLKKEGQKEEGERKREKRRERVDATWMWLFLGSEDGEILVSMLYSVIINRS